ncbi:putative GrpE nucleotide exchange factor [Helianthus annuus]|nr:putative GrpE nucleotide exchange factor [Helianthus annuus]KAJ0944281.1 putative GrpE nucleotide exchange factor [Helianthus annuus]
MLVGRTTSRIARTVVTRYRTSLILNGGLNNHLPISTFRNQFHSLSDSQNKVIAGQISSLHNSTCNLSGFQRFGFSSSASPESNEKESENGRTTTGSSNDEKESANSDDKGQGEEDLTMEDLIKLVTEKEELLKIKQEEIEKMKDKVLRTYADMENIMDRTKRESENSKKFAIQNFAKSLLDVADNLDRASSVVKESFAKIDTSEDTAGAVPLLKTLLEGVEMTEKQLAEVLKKFGVEKYDPTNEEFDPNRHNAVFQVPDDTKPPGTVAVVLKAGYMLHDRIIRPAEVGVTIKAD